MKKTTLLPRVVGWKAVATGLLTLIPVCGFGQAAPPPSPATGASAETPVVLSPFQVDASQDTGYRVTRDTTGSRLAMPIRDVPASITVFTQEMLKDLNVTNVQEALVHAPNVDFTEFTAGIGDISMVKMNIRGFRNAGRGGTQDYFETYDDLDAYKLERLGFSRGANGVLFGIGDPGGQITASPKKANFYGNRYELSARVDSWGGWRGTAEANQILVSQRLALRAVLLKQDKREGIHDQYQKDDRIFLTTTANLFTRPNLRTSFRANIEHINGTDVYGNVIFPIDTVSPWLAAGAPRGRVNAPPPGTANQSSGTKLVYITGQVSPDVPVQNWANTLHTMGLTPSIPVMEERLYPYNRNPRGTGSIAPREMTFWTAFLEQQLGPDLFFEAALYHGEDFRRHALTNDARTLRADPNDFMPNGQPNPNAGKFYLETNSSTQDRSNWRDTYRFTGTYKFDFKKINDRLGHWLGHHQFMAGYEKTHAKLAWEFLRVVNATPLPGAPTQLDNAANFITTRSYLDFSRGIYSFEPDIRKLEARDGVTPRTLPVQDQNLNVTKPRSDLLAIQSNFWDGRILTTLGWRTDRLTTFTGRGARARDPVTGLRPLLKDDYIDPGTRAEREFSPTSKGVIVRPLPWIGVYYNEGKNFLSAEPSQKTWFNQPIPARGGIGEDYGIRLELFDDKASVNLNWYEASGVNAITHVGNADGVNRIWTTLNRPEMLLPASPSVRDTSDETAKGWEFTAQYDPTQNWRIDFSLTKNRTVATNIVPGWRAYAAQHLATWQANAARPIVGAEGTIGEEIERLTTAGANAVSNEGNTVFNMREWNASLATNYRFTSGRFRNASVGGSVLYRGDAISGYPIVAGVPQFNQPFEEPGYYIMNINLGYDYTFRGSGSEGKRLSTRLTFRNALDHDGRVIVTERNAIAGPGRSAVGTPTRARWIEGTSVLLTTTFRL